MKAIPIFASVLMLAAGAAAAQTSKQSGGNVPLAQGPCAAGYENSVKDGRMNRLSATTMKSVDTNNDGRISRTEFNNACTKRLFKELDGKG